jgi:hypothetical protein
VQRQGAGLYALTHNAVLIWYICPGILTAELKERLHPELNQRSLFLQSFL